MKNTSEFIPTRQSLLSRLKDREDQESWKAFFDTYWKLIYNAAIRAGLNEAEAQDVVQETVIAIAKKMPDFVYDPAKGSFKTWLMRQTNWRILGQFRKRMPISFSRVQHDTGTGTTTLERVPDPNPSPLDALWDEEWERNLMEVAANRVKKKVDPKHYQIFDLCVMKKWPIRTVASDLRVSTAMVYLIKHRIGKLFKQEIDQLKTKHM